MDTRTKILSNDDARRIANALVVSGSFDPMTRAHAERLASLKRPGQALLVLIATPPDPILPSAARAALVAGLACVDHVTEIDSAYPEGLQPSVQLESEDAVRLEQLIQHVKARQATA